MKKMTKAMLMTALILGSVQWGGTAVHANELQEFSLDEYVVTAARTETKLVDTPANISVVTAEQIESRHYTNVAEALKDVPGANVVDSGTGASEKCIFLNGDERVLILVDGRRVSMDMGTMTGRASYDTNMLPDVGLIERIEILKGAGSSLYGSDAVGGVINIITKKGDRSYGKVSVGVGSFGAEDVNAMYSFKQGKTGVTVSAGKYKQDYYKYRDYKTDTTKKWATPSDYENEKVSLKIEQELSDDSNITVGYDYSKFDGNSPGAMQYASSSLVEKKTENIYAKYDWTLKGKDKGYLQYYHNEYYYDNQGWMEEKADGIDLQQELSLSNTNKMVVGTSWRKANVFNVMAYKDENSVDNTAIFVNDAWNFAPTWTLNLGARYDNHSEVGDETTFSAGLNKKFGEDSHAYVNWGQVFKAPTTDDLYYDYGGWYEAGTDLKAETGDMWTIGYSANVNSKTNININYFESDIDDAIAWLTDPVTYKYRSTNVTKQKKNGMEFSVQHSLNDNVDLQASYTYVQVKNDCNNQGELRDFNYMPNTYRLGVNYHDGKWDSTIWLRAASGGSTNSNPHYAYGGTLMPSGKLSYLDSNYLTIDVAVNYKANENLKIFAKAYNLLNEAYCEQGGVNTHTGDSYNYPAQSRRFLIGAEYSF